MTMLLIASCAACGDTIFGANTEHCPSLRIQGKREPICLGCFDRWNRIHRTDRGLEPVPLHPEAYGPESED